MKLKNNETSSEKIMVSSCCEAECSYGSNDIDSYYECDECGETDFTGGMKAREAEKITITLTYLK